MTFKNHFNAGNSPGRKITQASATIPNQTMSVKEIMIRHTRGYPTNFDPSFQFEDPDDENDEQIFNEVDLTGMDRQDLHDLMEENQKRIQTLQSDIKRAPKRKKPEPPKETPAVVETPAVPST